MPTHKLTDTERRDITLAALSGVSPSKLASEYGISRAYVHKLREDAKKNVETEYEFWSAVRRRVGRNRKERSNG